jgi:hypothetical protein
MNYACLLRSDGARQGQWNQQDRRAGDRISDPSTR